MSTFVVVGFRQFKGKVCISYRQAEAGEEKTVFSIHESSLMFPAEVTKLGGN